MISGHLRHTSLAVRTEAPRMNFLFVKSSQSVSQNKVGFKIEGMELKQLLFFQTEDELMGYTREEIKIISTVSQQ